MKNSTDPELPKDGSDNEYRYDSQDPANDPWRADMLKQIAEFNAQAKPPEAEETQHDE